MNRFPNLTALLSSGTRVYVREASIAKNYPELRRTVERWYPPYSEDEYLDLFGVTDFGRGVVLEHHEIDERLDGRRAAEDTKRVLGGTI